MTYPILICLTLCSANAVSVTVVDKHGEAVQGAQVTVATSPDLASDGIASGATDANGKWSCELPADPTTFWIQASRLSDKKNLVRSATLRIDRAAAITNGVRIRVDELERADYHRRYQRPSVAAQYPCECFNGYWIPSGTWTRCGSYSHPAQRSVVVQECQPCQ